MKTVRRHASALAHLLREPHGYEFFQAVRLLERWLHQRDGGQPTHKQLKFNNSLSLAFPASEIAALRLERRADGLPHIGDVDGQALDLAQVAAVQLTPAFFGLLGINGALPVHYSDMLGERESRQRDADAPAARAFLDIFQHRAVLAFYQAWRKHRLELQFEHDRRNRFLPLMLAVGGLGQRSLHQRLGGERGGVSDDALAFYASVLQRRPMSQAALVGVLQQYFGVPVQVKAFVGSWVQKPPALHARLGVAQVCLGRDAMLGERLWQRHQRVGLTLGPLSKAQFDGFLPGGAAALALRHWLSLMCGEQFEFSVRLTVAGADVRGVRLDDSGSARLGWDSFLITRAETLDRTEAGYELMTLH
ncbi:type VI secretion system baseplate subunit TssG [Roseateles sp. BYS180W]|uniref:Type VI secretion system baseplate subunit TssG n=1 Tax=Roseateles rivi TaxID=3299028 RepID=A0ABW7FS04_9BURK